MSELHYRVHPGDGPPMLLVHGFLCSSAQWHANLHALGRFVQPVTVDLWGHGDSPTPADPEAFHPARYVAELDAIRAALGAERCCLGGYSLGAALTLRYALEQPERVLAHVMTNSNSAFASDEQLRAWREEAEASATRIRAGGTAAVERMPMHPGHARHLDRRVREAVLADAERLDPAAVARTVTHTTPHASCRALAAENRVPTALVNGRLERRFQPVRDWAAKHVPNLEVADLDTGHATNMAAPAAFDAAVCAFLERVLTEAGA